MFKKILIFSTFLSVLIGIVGYYYNTKLNQYITNSPEKTAITPKQTSQVFSSNSGQDSLAIAESSENLLPDVPVYPFLVTSQGVFDQTMKKVISFDKEQNSKSQFQFMGRDLISLDSLRNYNLTKIKNNYYTHDGKNLTIVPNGNFENIKKIDLGIEILYVKATEDKLFVVGYDQNKCPIKDGETDPKTCKFDLYYYDNLKELKYLNSHFGIDWKEPGYTIPDYADENSFWLTSGYGDSCGNNSVFGKFNYEGEYVEGYLVDNVCGNVKLSRLTYAEYKTKDSYYGIVKEAEKVLYSDSCISGSDGIVLGSPSCNKIDIELKEQSSKYIPKELVIYDQNPPEKYYTCENYKVKNYDGYNAKYYYKNDEILQNLNAPYGEMLGCEDWSFFRNDKSHKNDLGYNYKEKKVESSNFLFECNTSGKLLLGICYIKNKDNQEIAKLRVSGFPEIKLEDDNMTEFVTEFNGYAVCSNHKYQINNQTNEITEIKPYGDCPTKQ